MKKKQEVKIFIICAIIAITSSIASVYASNYLFASSEVSYDNTNSGLAAVNVQEALDELYGDATDYTDIIQRLTALENNFLDKTYPVGSIYISATDSTVAAVQTRFGGTWEKFGEGRTLVSANSTYQINTTGGTASESYTPAGTVGNTKLTAAQSGLPAHGHGFTNPTYSVSGGYVKNGITGGSHTHNMQMNSTAYLTLQSASGWRLPYGTTDAGSRYTVKSSTHTHDLPNHTHTVTVETNGSVSNNTGSAAAETHTHSFTGTEATISHMQPYITVYMYKRKS